MASKWWKQENIAAKFVCFYYSTTTGGTRSHKHVQNASQHRIYFVGMVTIDLDRVLSRATAQLLLLETQEAKGKIPA